MQWYDDIASREAVDFYGILRQFRLGVTANDPGLNVLRTCL